MVSVYFMILILFRWLKLPQCPEAWTWIQDMGRTRDGYTDATNIEKVGHDLARNANEYMCIYYTYMFVYINTYTHGIYVKTIKYSR